MPVSGGPADGPTNPPTQDPEPSAARWGSWELIRNVVGAAAASVGILGFVTLAGGVVMFERFSAAGLPAEHGVAVIPRDDLLVVGAHALAPLTIFVLIALVVLWEVFRGVDLAMSRLGQGRDHTDSTRPLRQLVVMCVSVASATFIYFAFVHKGGPAPSPSHLAALAVATYGGALMFGLSWARAQYPASEGGITKAVGRLRLSGRALAEVAMVSVLVVLTVGLVISWVSADERPNVQPAAVVTSRDGRGIYGLLIAETSDYIYVAKVTERSDDQYLGQRLSTQMIQIPRASVVALSIGTNQSLPVALGRAPKLFDQLAAAVVAGNL